MARRIIQFGTSRFLQAHVDLFVHEARLSGADIGPISVVKTSADVGRAHRISAFRRTGGFPVRIRGFRAGALVDEAVQVQSIDRAFDAQHDWPQIVDHFATDAEIAVSNVGDQGYEVADRDLSFDFTSKETPTSFPAKLLLLLHARYEAGGRPLLFLPTELVASNGQVLRRVVTDLATEWSAGAAFKEWLAQAVVFADTLVDRIVGQEIQPLGAVTEPYALWAIRRGDFMTPLHHPAVVMTNDLKPYERLKLYILNLGHTLLADQWLRRGGASSETVASILNAPGVAERLDAIYALEVVPGFAAHGMTDEASRYVQTTLVRFRNPFLDHRVADIAHHHNVKVTRRLAAFIDWVHEREPGLRLPELTAVVRAAQ